MKKFYLQIPEPCHEDWSKMTPSEKGRYCQNCSKAVVDFTLMTDREILNYFSQAQGRTCGHFANDQLNRVLKEPATPARKNIWAMMFSFILPVFAWNKTTAQGNVIVDTGQSEIPKAIAYGDVRKVAITDSVKQYIVKGIVTDAEGNPLQSATVMMKGTRRGTATDSKGCFQLKIDTAKNEKLIFSYIGHEEREVDVSPARSVINVNLPRTEEAFFVGLVVTTKAKKKPVAKKIIDTLSRAIEPSKITVFPNPVASGGTVSIKLKNIASYECYLIDNQGNIIETSSQEKISKSEARLQIPSSIVPGMYYITVFDKRSKKKHTEKIVIQ